MYTIEHRGAKKISSSNTVLFDEGQLTYGWRTGRYAQPAPPPSWNGDLGVYLRQRNDYMSDLIATMPLEGGDFSSDTGHKFQTLKFQSLAGAYAESTTVGSTPPISQRGSYRLQTPCVPTSAYAFARRYSGMFPWADGAPTLPNNGLVDAAERRLVTGAWANMDPSTRIGWGETFVELLAGNFPKVVPDLVRRYKSVSSKQVKIWKDADARKAAGGDYLNARFAIEPIIRDTVATVSALIGVSALVYDTVKRSRSTLPQSGTFPGYAVGGSFLRLGETLEGHWQANTRIKAKLFKAQPGATANGFLDKAQAVVQAAGVDYQLVWDLTPWSWLLDWCTNIGTTISNATTYSAGKGRWGIQYAWETYRYESTVSLPPANWTAYGAGWETRRERGYAMHRCVYLQRERGNPVRVGFQIPTLSNYQLAIVAALGLTLRR